MSVRRHNPSRSRGGRRAVRHVRRARRSQRRWALAALSPVTALAVLLLAAVALSIWSCATSDPAYPKRRSATAPAPTAASSAETPSAPIAVSAMFDAEPDIRVRVRQAVETVKFESATPIEASLPQGKPLVLSGPVTVHSEPTGLRLVAGTGDAFTVGAGVDVTFVATAGDSYGSRPASTGAAPGHIRVDGVDFPGAITLRRASDTSPLAFDIIATMSIEDYLPGVLSKELFANWPLAAYEAQAVCARTYALFVRGLDRAAGRPFDVENSQADQVYGGATTNVTALRAVRNTRGVVLTYNGSLFKAYYSSTCGGRAGSAADVWPISRGFEYNLAAPIQGAAREHYCQAARLYRWETTRTADELGKRLTAWGRTSGNAVRGIGSVRSVTVEKVNQTGRPSRYAVIDDRGRTFSLSAEELRVGCNASVEGLPAITPQTRVNSNDLEFVSYPATELAFVIRGRGFGHGVGMCQWCLKGMADRGIAWDRQVLTFYPGAQIVRGYQ